MFVPIVVCERLAEACVEGIVKPDIGPHSHLEIYDVQATDFRSGPIDRSPRLCLKPADNVPAEEFDYGCQPEMASAIESVAWADAVKENVTGEPFRPGNRNSRRSSDGVPISDLTLNRESA